MQTEAERKAKVSAYNRAYRIKNRERIAIVQRAYRKRNKERIAARAKTYRIEHADKIAAKDREYRQTHKEERAATDKAWYKANRERLAARNKVYRDSHKEETRVYDKARRAQYPAQTVELDRKNSLRKRGVELGHTPAEWETMLIRFGYLCLCCGRSTDDIHRDHVVPISKGGTDEIANIQPLCNVCNSRKSNKIIDYRGGTN